MLSVSCVGSLLDMTGDMDDFDDVSPAYGAVVAGKYNRRGHVINIPTMPLLTQIPGYTQSKSYM